MTRRNWFVFATIQFIGAIALLASARFAFDYTHERLAAVLWYTSHYLLLPGNLIGSALLPTLHLWFLGFLPTAIALNAGFWLLCAAASRVVKEHIGGTKSHRYAIALLVTTTLFIIANVVYEWMWPAMCADCFAPHGVPFALYHEGGYAGGEAIMWLGLVADAAIVVAAGVLLGGTWSRYARRQIA